MTLNRTVLELKSFSTAEGVIFHVSSQSYRVGIEIGVVGKDKVALGVSQSYRVGIEIKRALPTGIAATYPLNRTVLELKCPFEIQIIPNVQSLNRTVLELKFCLWFGA